MHGSFQCLSSRVYKKRLQQHIMGWPDMLAFGSPIQQKKKNECIIIDLLLQTWLRLRLYAFPLIPLLPGRVWFSDLISLLNGSPWEILVRRDLFSQAGGTIVHPLPQSCGSCGRGP